MRGARSLGLVLWLGVAVSSAGCIASPAPRDHFYRLEVGPPGATLPRPALAGTLEVNRLSATALARERAMLRGESEHSTEVTPYPYSLWVDSPTLLLQRGLADYLRRAGLAEKVVTASAGADASWAVSGYLSRFEHLVGGSSRVLVELELRLARTGRGGLVLSETYRVEQPAGDGVEEAAVAFGAATRQIFERFVRDVEASAR